MTNSEMKAYATAYRAIEQATEILRKARVEIAAGRDMKRRDRIHETKVAHELQAGAEGLANARRALIQHCEDAAAEDCLVCNPCLRNEAPQRA